MSDLIDRQTAIDAILRLTRYDTVRSLYEATVADKYDDYKDGIMDAIDALIGVDVPKLRVRIERVNPCDVCKYNPPSAMDGKPCAVCPAAGKEESAWGD